VFRGGSINAGFEHQIYPEEIERAWAIINSHAKGDPDQADSNIRRDLYV
jgi:hypothetical protein